MASPEHIDNTSDSSGYRAFLSRSPVERELNETPAAYRAFLLWKNFTPAERSFSVLANELAVSEDQLKRWHRAHHWKSRTEFADTLLLEKQQLFSDESRYLQLQQQLADGKLLSGKARQRLVRLIPDELSIARAQDMLIAGHELSKSALGINDRSPAISINNNLQVSNSVTMVWGNRIPKWANAERVKVDAPILNPQDSPALSCVANPSALEQSRGALAGEPLLNDNVNGLAIVQSTSANPIERNGAGERVNEKGSTPARAQGTVRGRAPQVARGPEKSGRSSNKKVKRTRR